MIINKIGLELHFQLKTKTKLFSSARNQFTSTPNVLTTSYDWGYPGTLPQLNIKVVELSLQGSYLLNCQIADFVRFDRKNYYYFDLPKGYQITQFYKPIGAKGYFFIFLPNEKWKKIRITRASIEEDTARTIYEDNSIFVDYNRSGAPLLEVTTEPDFTNYQEVEIFSKKIIRLFRKTLISKADFSKSSLRIDLNISTSVDGINFSPRSEIKNLNSLHNIKKTIQKETILQLKLLKQTKQTKELLTKNYDEKTKELITLRAKFNEYDYCFIPENNIAPIFLKQDFVQESILKIKHLLNWEDDLIRDYKLDFSYANFLLNKDFLIPYFLQLQKNKLLKYINVFLFLREIIIPYSLNGGTFAKFNFQIFERLLLFYEQKKINFQDLKDIFNQYQNKNESFDLKNLLIKKQNIILLPKQIDDLYELLDDLCQNDKKLYQTYQNKPNQTINYLIGKILSKLKNQVNPKTLTQIIKNYFALPKKMK